MAAACGTVNLLAATKLEILGQTDTHFGQMLALTSNSNSIGPHSWVGCDKCFFNEIGVNLPTSCKIAQAGWNTDL